MPRSRRLCCPAPEPWDASWVRDDHPTPAVRKEPFGMGGVVGYNMYVHGTVETHTGGWENERPHPDRG